MCGICGIRQFKGEAIDPEKLEQMKSALKHRGPDGEGTYCSDDRRLALGHRRLSIIDLSRDGEQPMQYDNGRYTITYNGELYNYLELRDELEKSGYKFRSRTDTEVVLAAYSHEGESCLQAFDGMYSFAIWDREKEELFCARDRFGEKPFFYYLDDEQFVFASEMKALWAGGVNKHLRLDKAYSYLLFSTLQDYDNQSDTLYQKVYALPPATFMKINAEGEIRKESYWDLKEINNPLDITIEDAAAKIDEMLQLSVGRRLRSDVPLGSSLSGGLDSSSIVATIHQMKGKDHQQRTYSARFPEFDQDEGKFMKILLEQYPGIDANFVEITEERLQKNFEKVLQIQDEPFGSFSISAQYEVFDLAAANGVKVMLDGQGADEYLAGYDFYYPYYFESLYRKDKAAFRRETDAFREMKGVPYQGWDKGDRFRNQFPDLGRFVADKRRQMLSARHPVFRGLHPELVKEYKSQANPRSFHSSLKDALRTSVSKKGLSELLRYADRNSMAHSLELRLPFLFHPLVEFVLQLPEDYLIRNAWTKFVLRKATAYKLPEEISWRKDKIGFATPQDAWLKLPKMKERIAESIDQLKREKIIEREDESLHWNYLMLSQYMPS